MQSIKALQPILMKFLETRRKVQKQVDIKVNGGNMQHRKTVRQRYNENNFP